MGSERERQGKDASAGGEVEALARSRGGESEMAGIKSAE